MSYNLGDGEISIQLSNVQVSNGQYHNVTLERYGKEFMLKLDSGEGRYYAESLGPVNGMMEFKTRQDQIHSGANVLYTSGQGVFSGEDLVSSMYCSSIIIKRWNMFKLLLPSWERVDLY